jgi:hypothetical protein
MIDKIYHLFLYCAGFALTPSDIGIGGEHITDMLKRQKARFGVWWWVASIGFIVISLLFYIWLLLHVIGIKPFGSNK